VRPESSPSASRCSLPPVHHESGPEPALCAIRTVVHLRSGLCDRNALNLEYRWRVLSLPPPMCPPSRRHGVPAKGHARAPAPPGWGPPFSDRMPNLAGRVEPFCRQICPTFVTAGPPALVIYQLPRGPPPSKANSIGRLLSDVGHCYCGPLTVLAQFTTSGLSEGKLRCMSMHFPLMINPRPGSPRGGFLLVTYLGFVICITVVRRAACSGSHPAARGIVPLVGNRRLQ
jgi:hypothetical protein